MTGFAPKYLLDGKNIDIIPEELKQEVTQKDLFQDRKIALQKTIKSHN